MTTKHRKPRAKYTKELLEPLVARNTSVAGVMRDLGCTVLLGGSHSHVSRVIQSLQLDTRHFTRKGTNKGKPSANKLSADEILVRRLAGSARSPGHLLRRALTEIGVPYVCRTCGLPPEWNGLPLTLEVNHIDGDPLNNVRDNLEFLCHNCHAQTSTFGSKNKLLKKKYSKYSSTTKVCLSCKKEFRIKRATQACCSKRCAGILREVRKVVRPSYEQILADLENNGGNFCAVSRLYGVTDNAVRKWIKQYERDASSKA